MEKKEVKPRGYWTYEKCYEESLKYKTRSDFQMANRGAYDAARRNGWLNDFGFEKGVDRGEVYWIYAYEDVENKAVYVGLTFRKRRDLEHKTDETDAVKLYFGSINKPVPEPRIKMDGLNAEDAQYYEDWYKQKYAEAGWKVLNRAKTGVGSGSLGNAIIKWDYEHCKEEAKKYETRTDFQKFCNGAYTISRKNGWLDEFGLKSKKKTNGYWLNYEHCKEEAEKYQTRSEFYRNSKGAYNVSLRNGWLDDFLPEAKWTYEKCKEESTKYNTRSKFEKGCGSAYKAARINGWLKDFDFEDVVRPKGYWTYERCKEEALKYKTRSAFKKGSKSAYTIARKNGWLKDFEFEDVIKPSGYWSFDQCQKEAFKYETRGSFKKGCGSGYAIALRNGWLDEFFPKTA